MVASRTGFNSKTLNELLKQPNASVFRRKCKRHIALAPSALSDIKVAIRAHLNGLVKRFDAELDGVVIGFRKINVLTDLGAILDDSPHIHIDIEAEFYVFKPEKGSILTGVVKKKSRDNIGCLVHDIFNASIPLDIDDGVDVENIDIGEPLTFRVEEVDFSESLPYIKGKLVDPPKAETNEQTTLGKKRKRTDDHQLGKKIKTEVHNSSEEEESIPTTFNINHDFPISILKKNNSVAIDGSPARRISFFGDFSTTSNEIQDLRKSANENSPLKEKKKKKKETGNVTLSSPESLISSKKIKMSVGEIENRLLETDDKDDEHNNLSTPVELKTKKKKKNKLKDQEYGILDPRCEEHMMDDSNESLKKKKKQNVFEPEISNFEDLDGDPSVTTDSSMQILNNKMKKKAKSLKNKEEEFKTSSDDGLSPNNTNSLQKLNNKMKKKAKSLKNEEEEFKTSSDDALSPNNTNSVVANKRHKLSRELEVDVRGAGEPDSLQSNQFLFEQKIKKKKGKDTGRLEEDGGTSGAIGIRGLEEVKKNQKTNEEKNCIENSLKREKGDSNTIKINESASEKHKTKKERKIHQNEVNAERSAEVGDEEWHDANETFVFETKKKKKKKEKNNNRDEIAKKRDEEKHESHEEYEEEDVHSNKSHCNLLLNDTNIKKKRKRKDVENVEHSLHEFGEKGTELKSGSIANSTIMTSTERLKKKQKCSSNMDMSFEFLSPIKESNNSPEIHDDLGFITSTQIETVPKIKRKSQPRKEGKASLSNLPKSKELVYSSVPNTLDSLSPIKKVGNSPDNYEDNFGFITSTQRENVPQTKTIPSNTVRASKSPSKSPKRKSSISSSSADHDDNIVPSSQSERENMFKSSPLVRSDSLTKSVKPKRLFKDSSDKESPKSMQVDSENVGMKGTKSSKHLSQSDVSSDSDSSSSMDFSVPNSLREARESSNEAANKSIKGKEIKSTILKPGGSDSSSSDSDASPPTHIIAQKQAKKKSKARKPSPHRGAPRSVESDESSTDVRGPLGKAKSPEQSGRVFPTKLVDSNNESDANSSDSDLPSHMRRVSKKSLLPAGSVRSSVSPRTSISAPLETLAPQNKGPLSVSTSTSSEQKKKRKNSVEENSDHALKGLALDVIKPRSIEQQIKESRNDDGDLGYIHFPKPLNLSHGVKKHSDGEKNGDSDSGNLQPSKLQKATKSKLVAEKVNLKFGSQLASPKPLRSISGTSEDDSFEGAHNIMPSSDLSKVSVSTPKRTKNKSESHGRKTSESETDTVVKGMIQKIKPEKKVLSEEEEQQKDVIKPSKKNLKNRDTTSTENKTEVKRKKTSKSKDSEDPLRKDVKKKRTKKPKLNLDREALSVLADELLKKLE